MAAKKQSEKQDPNSRTVCRNRKARYQYDIIDEIECGIALRGSEVKSVRNAKISIDEAYARVDDGEVWLIGCDIAEYPQATVLNHEPRRARKLLLHKKQIEKFAESAGSQGFTLIPLAVYFSRGIIKVKLAAAKGRKLHDKREKLRKKTDTKEMQRALNSRRSR